MSLKRYKSKYDNYHMGQRLEDLKNVVQIQIQDPSSKTDPYMRGMANAFLIAWNIMAEPYGEEVEFIEAPKSAVDNGEIK